MKDGETSPILSKSLVYWKYAFFQHNELVPEAVWKLIEEEENGGSKTTSSIPDSVVISYKVLGLIEKSKLVDIAQSPQPMDCFEFIDWHMEKFKGKQRKKNQIEYKSEAILKQSKSVCRKPRGRHIKTEYSYQEEVKKINSTLKDSKSTIVSGNPSTDYSSLLTNIHETEKDLSTKFEQLKSWANDSSDSSDDDFILLPQPNFSKNPIRLEFEPPSIEWRQEKCRELNLSPFEPATIFGPSYVVPWNMPPKRIQKIKGDGNCLFRALVYFLTGHDSDILHVRMRYLICKYMEDHRDDPAILSWVQKYANNVMEYLDAGMRIPGKWGTEVEIQVFARMLNCIVAVWNPGYFANEDQIRWNRYNFYAMEYQPTLFLIFEKSHFNVCLM
uniref:OTU domain-containing protein n=1 Tax=Acrobeloides nanus TaxID=290746 RepID=A0A914DIW2_9BILA